MQPMHPDHREYAHFCGPRRVWKSLTTLHGILIGLLADGVQNTPEPVALRRWLEEHEDLRKRHPFSELYTTLMDDMFDGTLSEDEVQDAIWLCERLDPTHGHFMLDHDMMRLHGILGGIIADGNVTDRELRMLRDWLGEHEHLKAMWPYYEIESLVTHVLADGVIDAKEQQLLRHFFAEWTTVGGNRSVGLPLNELGQPITAMCAVCPEIVFEGAVFCFTGASAKVKRKQFASIVQQMGGAWSKNVTGYCNYVVIGAEGNPCWMFACYGRKIEKAVLYRQQGKGLVIVNEHDFWDALESQKGDRKIVWT